MLTGSTWWVGDDDSLKKCQKIKRCIIVDRDAIKEAQKCFNDVSPVRSRAARTVGVCARGEGWSGCCIRIDVWTIRPRGTLTSRDKDKCQDVQNR